MMTKIAKKVDPLSEETQKIIKTMFDTMQPNMIGLAAPQIGIFKRIILVDIKANGKGKAGDLRVYINPEITWMSKIKGEWYEGCYSVDRICGIVARPVSIKIKASGITKEKHSGYVARIFQHEIDHLNGKLFTSHITNPDHLHLVEEKEFPLYRNRQAWKNWPKKAPLPIA